MQPLLQDVPVFDDMLNVCLKMAQFSLQFSVHFKHVYFVVFIRFELDMSDFQLIILLCKLIELVGKNTFPVKACLVLSLFQLHPFLINFLLNVQLIDCGAFFLIILLLAFQILVQCLYSLLHVTNKVL